MKYCIKCGCRLENGALFCPSCGAEFPQPNSAAVNPPPNEYKAEPADEQNAPNQTAGHAYELKTDDAAASGCAAAAPVQAYAPYVYNSPQNVPVKPGKGLSIASMVIGITCCCFIFLSCCCILWPVLFALVISVVGLILGICAIKREPAGKGFAIAGIITNSIGILMFLIFILFIVLIITSADPLWNYEYFYDVAPALAGCL